MTLKEAWSKSEGRGVQFLARDGVPLRIVVSDTADIPVDEAMSDQWMPLVRPEPEKLTLAEALRRWPKVRRPDWPAWKCVARYNHLSIEDVEACDYVEEKS